MVALIAAGGIPYLIAAVRWLQRRRAAATPAGQRLAAIAEADQSVTVTAHARDELAEDNRRLRVIITEERTRHAEDRAQWASEKATMRKEIDSLETRAREMLAELIELKRRHA